MLLTCENIYVDKKKKMINGVDRKLEDYIMKQIFMK
jgi:hypothetical protein